MLHNMLRTKLGKSMAPSETRIDVHHHVLPEFYKDAQRAAGISGSAYRGFPEWTPEKSLALMNDHQIASTILSFTAPGIYFGDPVQTRDLARRCNDYLAALAQAHPGRFGGFAFLPLPDIDASLAEIERLVDDLKLDGVTLLTSVDERYIGHPDFEPVYEELNRRRVVTFIHPCYPPGTEARGWNIPRMMIDFPFETTRVATNLILNGVMERHRDIPFILSHAGGTLPFLAHRIAIFDKKISLQDNYPEGALAYMKRFYFDTALSGNKVPLDALSGIIDPSHILFGSDYPYVSEDVVAIETAGLDGYVGYDETTHAMINRGNAEKLFPRFAA